MTDPTLTGTAGHSAVYFDRHGGVHEAGSVQTGVYIEQVGPDAFTVQVHHDHGDATGVSRCWVIVSPAAGQAIRNGQAEAKRIVAEEARRQWDAWQKRAMPEPPDVSPPR